MTRVGHGAGLRAVLPAGPAPIFFAGEGEFAASFAEQNALPTSVLLTAQLPDRDFCDWPLWRGASTSQNRCC